MKLTEFHWILLADKGTTILILSRSYSKSRAGEMRHYVSINYADARLLKKSEEIVSDEL